MIYNCQFEAFEGRARVKLQFKNIDAPNTYEASDKVKLLVLNYERLTMPTFRFMLDRKPMPKRLAKIVASAGPEEE